jgi:hypothetical protein
LIAFIYFSLDVLSPYFCPYGGDVAMNADVAGAAAATIAVTVMFVHANFHLSAMFNHEVLYVELCAAQFFIEAWCGH